MRCGRGAVGLQAEPQLGAAWQQQTGAYDMQDSITLMSVVSFVVA